MEQIMEKLKQVNRILTGEEGPQLTLDRDEDARYIYPAKIKAALKVLRETESLLLDKSSGLDDLCDCDGWPLEADYCKYCGGHKGRCSKRKEAL